MTHVHSLGDSRRSVAFTCVLALLVATLLNARPGSCETVPVFEKSTSNVQIKILRKGSPSAGTEVLVDRLNEDAVLEHFTRTSDRDGFLHLRNLRVGGRYEIHIVESASNGQTYDLAWLYLQIVDEGHPRTSEFVLEVPERPRVQPLGALSGTVVDVTGEGIQDTTIEVTDIGSSPSQFVTRGWTDPRGRFSFQVPDGRYEVIFTKAGFQRARLILTVASDRLDAWHGFRLTMDIGGEGRYKPYPYSVAEDK